MNKLLTIIVPIYNTQDYLRKCLESLIIKETLIEKLEVLLIIDGSPDQSIEIANEFHRNYPNVFKVIEKENGGYGSVLKRGIKEAKGKYCKVLDSDDWYNSEALEIFIEKLKTVDTDVIVTDFVKEFVFENRHEIQLLPELENKKVYNLEQDINSFKGDVFVMHRLAYKAEVLRKSNINFPEKIFYTDTLFASIPLFVAKDLYYINLKLYRYYIGREGQTIAPENIRKNRKSVESVIKYYYDKFLENEQNLSIEKKKYALNSIKTLIEMYYRILHHMSFSDANKELAEWNKYVKKLKHYKSFKESKIIQYYNNLPYFIFRYTSFIWKN